MVHDSVFLGKRYYVMFDLWHEPSVFRLWCCCAQHRRLYT